MIEHSIYFFILGCPKSGKTSFISAVNELSNPPVSRDSFLPIPPVDPALLQVACFGRWTLQNSVILYFVEVDSWQTLFKPDLPNSTVDISGFIVFIENKAECIQIDKVILEQCRLNYPDVPRTIIVNKRNNSILNVNQISAALNLQNDEIVFTCNTHEIADVKAAIFFAQTNEKVKNFVITVKP